MVRLTSERPTLVTYNRYNEVTRSVNDGDAGYESDLTARVYGLDADIRFFTKNVDTPNNTIATWEPKPLPVAA